MICAILIKLTLCKIKEIGLQSLCITLYNLRKLIITIDYNVKVEMYYKVNADSMVIYLYSHYAAFICIFKVDYFDITLLSIVSQYIMYIFINFKTQYIMYIFINFKTPRIRKYTLIVPLYRHTILHVRRLRREQMTRFSIRGYIYIHVIKADLCIVLVRIISLYCIYFLRQHSQYVQISKENRQKNYDYSINVMNTIYNKLIVCWYSTMCRHDMVLLICWYSHMYIVTLVVSWCIHNIVCLIFWCRHMYMHGIVLLMSWYSYMYMHSIVHLVYWYSSVHTHNDIMFPVCWYSHDMHIHNRLLLGPSHIGSLTSGVTMYNIHYAAPDQPSLKKLKLNYNSMYKPSLHISNLRLLITQLGLQNPLILLITLTLNLLKIIRLYYNSVNTCVSLLLLWDHTNERGNLSQNKYTTCSTRQNRYKRCYR